MQYTFYAYFNQLEVVAFFNAIVSLISADDYGSLIRIGAVLGLFIAVAYGFFKANGIDAGSYIIALTIFYSALFVPRVTVIVEEAGAVAAPVAVDNVPLGLAFFASATSKIGHWLTQTTETFFALPDSNLNYGSHGLMGGARVLRESSSAAITNPVLKQNLYNFMRDCINPELANPVNGAAVIAIFSSTSLWADFANLGLINRGRMVAQVDAAGLKSCDQAYLDLEPQLLSEVTNEHSRIARMLNPGATLADANNSLAAMLPGAMTLVNVVSSTAQDELQQRMMINLLNDTSQSYAQMLNDPVAAQQAVATAMAAQSANSAYRVMAKIGQESLPMMRNSLELLIIGVFPIVLILIIIGGTRGGKVLHSYAMAMLWIQLWAPLYAIVNYVGTLANAKGLRSALEGVPGVAIQNSAQFVETAVSGEAIAGLMTILVPMIAYVVIKAGDAGVTGLVSSMTSPGQAAAQTTGASAGLGSVKAGDVSWGTFTARVTNTDKTDTDSNARSGAKTVRTPKMSELTTLPNGTEVLKTPKHDTPITGGLFGSMSAESAQQAEHSKASAWHSARKATDSIGALFSQNVAAGEFGSTTHRSGVESRQSESGTVRQGQAESTSRTEGTTASGTVRDANIANTGGNADIGGNLNTQNRAGKTKSKPGKDGDDPTIRTSDHESSSGSSGFNLGMSARLTQQYVAEVNKAIAAKDERAYTKAADRLISHLNEASQATTEGMSREGTDRSSNEKSAGLNEARQLLKEAGAQFDESQRYSETSRILAGASSQGGYNAASDALNRNFTASKLQNWLDRFRQADTGAERAQLASELAEAISGQSVSSGSMPSYLSGNRPTNSFGDIDSNYSKLLSDPRLRERAQADFQAFSRRVGEGETGTSSVPLSADQMKRVESFIATTKTMSDAAQGQRTEELRIGDLQFQVRAGFVDSDLYKDNIQTYNKLANTSSNHFAQDAYLGLEQALGRAPSFGEWQGEVYKRWTHSDAPSGYSDLPAELNRGH